MQFIIYTEDRPNSLHIRQENRVAHLAWLKSDNPKIKLLTAGPWLDDHGEMRGSMLIVEAGAKSDVKDWLAGDPYRAAGLTASTLIRGYVWAIGAPEA